MMNVGNTGEMTGGGERGTIDCSMMSSIRWYSLEAASKQRRGYENKKKIDMVDVGVAILSGFSRAIDGRVG